jgi:hypothetical protein
MHQATISNAQLGKCMYDASNAQQAMVLKQRTGLNEVSGGCTKCAKLQQCFV